jgi:hypothetical protein
MARSRSHSNTSSNSEGNVRSPGGHVKGLLQSVGIVLAGRPLQRMASQGVAASAGRGRAALRAKVLVPASRQGGTHAAAGHSRHPRHARPLRGRRMRDPVAAARRRLGSPAAAGARIALALCEVEAGMRAPRQLERLCHLSLWSKAVGAAAALGREVTVRSLVRVVAQEHTPGWPRSRCWCAAAGGWCRWRCGWTPLGRPPQRGSTARVA